VLYDIEKKLEVCSIVHGVSFTGIFPVYPCMGIKRDYSQRFLASFLTSQNNVLPYKNPRISYAVFPPIGRTLLS